MREVKIKVCGMKMASNIAMIAELLPDYLGFIFYKKSPRFISDVSAELIKYMPAPIKTVGVFVDEDLEAVKQCIVKHNLKAVQLHGSEDVKYCESLKNSGVEIIKAFGIDKDFDFNKLTEYVNRVDYFLFDTQTAEHGGSGRVFDWNLLINYTHQTPYFLSGGIDLESIEKLKQIEDPRLYAIDVNSKFEFEPGVKNVEKLTEFFEQVKV